MPKELLARETGTSVDWLGAECRVFERHECELLARCQPASGENTGIRWSATILDISLGGVRLLVRRRFEPGSVLAIEFSGGDGSQSCTGLAKVVHVGCRDSNSWVLGCTFFGGLTQEELETLVPTAKQRRASRTAKHRPPRNRSRRAGAAQSAPPPV